MQYIAYILLTCGNPPQLQISKLYRSDIATSIELTWSSRCLLLPPSSGHVFSCFPCLKACFLFANSMSWKQGREQSIRALSWPLNKTEMLGVVHENLNHFRQTDLTVPATRKVSKSAFPILWILCQTGVMSRSIAINFSHALQKKMNWMIVPGPGSPVPFSLKRMLM